MELFDALEKRHSYRGPFLDKPVNREDLNRIVQAALLAPSAKNAQTTAFIVVDDPELVRQIAVLHEFNVAFQQAKAFIGCLVDKEPEAVYEGYAFQIEDCAVATLSMLLAATALGYAGVWVDGWLRLKDHAAIIGKLLNIPEDKTLRIIIPLGVPAEERKQPTKKPLEERARFNRF
ncbi:MAG: nitroreductase family protein [FCB group bacterium]|jgi:nitroreductase|nr:nitroreductase family protein [FCB group bacterium]